MTLALGTRLGPYEVLSPLGAGGMGEVWRARDTRLERDVAIKVLPEAVAGDPKALARFRSEAKAVAALSHPNILALFDVGEEAGVHYVVTELLEGETLRALVSRGPLSVRRAVGIARELAEALAAAHGKGIVHRDVKPENVFLTKDGRVKLLDFGLARLGPGGRRPEDTRSPTLELGTDPGAVVGTVSYMSPQQVRGESIDEGTDLFSLGVVLYEMLAGRRPFQRPNLAETMSAILREEPPDLSEANRRVPAALEKLVRRCLEKDPAARFQSASDLVFALAALPEVTSETAAVPMSPAGAWVHRHRASLAGAALLAVLATASLLAVRGRRDVPASPGLVSVLALPCKVHGAPESAFLTDAVPGTISTLLAQVEGIDTKVPPSSFEVEKVKGDLAALAELYRVSAFVVTSITASPGRLVLNVQLVDVATRRVKWGREYEGPRETYGDLAREAANGVRAALKPGVAPVPTASTSSAAELALREGSYFANRYGLRHEQADFDVALGALRKALDLDPSLATAAARIAGLHASKAEAEGPASEAIKESVEWARRAVEIDRRCGMAWATLASLESSKAKPDVDLQLEYALRGAALSPREALPHMVISNAPGTLSLSIAAALKAAEVDPFFLWASGNVVMGLCPLGRPAEALPFVDRVARVEPDTWLSQLIRGLALAKLGRFEEARRAMAPWEKHFVENPRSFLSQVWGQIRFDLAAAERDTTTIAALEKHLLRPLLDGSAESITLWNATVFVCPALARLGRRDESIRILLRSVDAGIPPPYDFLLRDTELRTLRDDPRFATVLAASRDGAAKIAGTLERARARGELPAYLEKPLRELNELLKGGPEGQRSAREEPSRS